MRKATQAELQRAHDVVRRYAEEKLDLDIRGMRPDDIWALVLADLINWPDRSPLRREA